MKSMRAAFLRRHGGPEVLEVGEIAVPTIRPIEVLVRVRFAALNHLDLWIRRGLPHLKLKYPHILGADASGVIAQVGQEVSHLKEGDEVIVHPGLSCGHCEACLSGWESLCAHYHILGEHTDGTNAEYVKVPAANIFAKPKELSFEQAASVPLVFTTAWQMAVRRAKVEPGKVVLIHAAGSGVSSAAIQIARVLGAQVIATAGDDRKLALARGLGAHHLINYHTDDWAVEVKQICPKGVDVILDHVGAVHWETNLRLLRSGGELVTCGASSGYEAKTDLRYVFFRQLRITGSTMGSKADFPAILGELSRGVFQPVVDRTFPLAEIRQAHERLESHGVFGKVLLSI